MALAIPLPFCLSRLGGQPFFNRCCFFSLVANGLGYE